MQEVLSLLFALYVRVYMIKVWNLNISGKYWNVIIIMHVPSMYYFHAGWGWPILRDVHDKSMHDNNSSLA